MNIARQYKLYRLGVTVDKKLHDTFLFIDHMFDKLDMAKVAPPKENDFWHVDEINNIYFIDQKDGNKIYMKIDGKYLECLDENFLDFLRKSNISDYVIKESIKHLFYVHLGIKDIVPTEYMPSHENFWVWRKRDDWEIIDKDEYKKTI